MTATTLFPNVTDSTPKAYRCGTHRLIGPEETMARARPFLGTMGITRIANVTGLDCIGVHVAQAIRPNSRSLAVSQGKGLTLAAAKASALMESIEAYQPSGSRCRSRSAATTTSPRPTGSSTSGPSAGRR